MAEKAAEKAAPAGIQASLEELNRPGTQRLLANVLAMPAMRSAARQLAGNVVEGALDSVDNPERNARIQAIAATYVDQFSAAVGTGMREQITPEVRRMMREAVAASMAEALGDASRNQAANFAAVVARAGTNAALEEVARGLTSHIGPAMQKVLAENIAPELEAIAKESLPRALAPMMREATKQSVLGAYDAFAELNRGGRLEQTGLPFLKPLNRTLSYGTMLAFGVAAVLAVAVVALLLWLRKIRVQIRAEQAANSRRQSTALLLAEAIRASEGRPWSKELRQILRETMRDQTLDDSLQDLLSSDPGVRPKQRNGGAQEPRPRN